MTDTNWKKRLGVVYSTDPEYHYQDEPSKNQETLPAEKQNLRIWLDRIKGGKVVSRIEGFAGSNDDLKKLASIIKSSCGTGGSTKDNVILIQGDFRNKILDLLQSKGYQAKKAGG
jgi:translation initiation factor 1